jgi:superfamily II DNA helicase RecQ
VAELTTEPSADRIVSSHRPEPVAPRARVVSGSGTDDPAADLDEAGQRRYAALRDLRNDLRDGKPAYVVFDNKTLAAIARRAPTTLQELSRIPGVGPAKLERFGEAVIALLQAHP